MSSVPVEARPTGTEESQPPVLPAFATGPVVGLAVAASALLAVFASRYGYHRDELYFLSASHHLDFGYVDQPPVAVLVAWLARVAGGNTVWGLRMVPALVSGGIVVLTGAMAQGAWRIAVRAGLRLVVCDDGRAARCRSPRGSDCVRRVDLGGHVVVGAPSPAHRRRSAVARRRRSGRRRPGSQEHDLAAARRAGDRTGGPAAVSDRS